MNHTFEHELLEVEYGLFVEWAIVNTQSNIIEVHFWGEIKKWQYYKKINS